jgi:hypothetical protein
MAETVTHNQDGCEYTRRISCGGPNGCVFELCGKDIVCRIDFWEDNTMGLCLDHLIKIQEDIYFEIERADSRRYEYKKNKINQSSKSVVEVLLTIEDDVNYQALEKKTLRALGRKATLEKQIKMLIKEGVTDRSNLYDYYHRT